MLTATTQPDWIGWAIGVVGIALSVVLAWAAIRAANAANRLAAQGNEMANAANSLAEDANRLAEDALALSHQAIDLTRRAERRRYGDAVQAYYASRREDLRTGNHWNAPHYTHAVMGVANEVQEPNSDALLVWLTETIDLVLDPRTYGTEDSDARYLEFRRQSDFVRLEMTVPIEIGRWVHDPAHYVPDRFIAEREMEVGVRHEPGP